MLSEDQVLDLMKARFGDDLRHFHDYAPRDLVDAFWIGYRTGVTDSRPLPAGNREGGD